MNASFLTPVGRLSRKAPLLTRFSDPLTGIAALIILCSCAMLHYYALGAQHETGLLAYDESLAWSADSMLAETQAATGSEVLFSMTTSQDVGFDKVDTIQSAPSSFQREPISPPFTSISATSDIGATLLALNYGMY